MSFDFIELSEALECSFTSRVALRPVALSDAWPLFAATRNPAFNRHLSWAQPENEELVLKRVRLIMDASRRGRLTALSAVRRSTGEFIALFRFIPHATLNDTVEMGVWMHDKFWHGRYGLELGQLCVSGAFSLSNVSRLLGASTLDNRGSFHLMKAVGMTEGGLVERDFEIGRLTLREFTITRAEWAARHATAFSVFDDGRVSQHLPPSRATVPLEVPVVAMELSAGAPVTVTDELQHA
ncbi:MAG: GNAT family N-acetyltransferase [Burkholderiaceae bacterium]|nr:GNAT family N-acetyltransferase [Burkholderiaceae bacterium]